jgi:hypothetical protein
LHSSAKKKNCVDIANEHDAWKISDSDSASRSSSSDSSSGDDTGDDDDSTSDSSGSDSNSEVDEQQPQRQFTPIRRGMLIDEDEPTPPPVAAADLVPTANKKANEIAAAAGNDSGLRGVRHIVPRVSAARAARARSDTDRSNAAHLKAVGAFACTAVSAAGLASVVDAAADGVVAVIDGKEYSRFTVSSKVQKTGDGIHVTVHVTVQPSASAIAATSVDQPQPAQLAVDVAAAATPARGVPDATRELIFSGTPAHAATHTAVASPDAVLPAQSLSCDYCQTVNARAQRSTNSMQRKIDERNNELKQLRAIITAYSQPATCSRFAAVAASNPVSRPHPGARKTLIG